MSPITARSLTNPMPFDERVKLGVPKPKVRRGMPKETVLAIWHSDLGRTETAVKFRVTVCQVESIWKRHAYKADTNELPDRDRKH